MKRFGRGIPLLVALVACSIAIRAQGFSVESKTAPSVTASLGSEPFTSLEGRFTISLPQTVHSYQPLSFKGPGGMAKGEAYNWVMAEGRFRVTYVNAPPSMATPNVVLNQLRDQVLAQISAAKGKLLSETVISKSGSEGRELKMGLPDSFLTLRVYLTGSRVYQLLLTASSTQQEKEALALKALDSFKLLTVADVDTALKKKIAEATPGPLPQEPIVKRPKSDAQDDGLKGRVKIVATEQTDLLGTWVVDKRKPSSTYYYNERGNLTKKEVYDYRGNPMDITVYGFLDGDRVSSTKSIRYEYDPPPGMAPPSQVGPVPKRDPRYSGKFKYKYDDTGNLREKEMYGNDGKLWLRYVYTLREKQREELAYSSDGSLNQKQVSALDEKGNVIEEVYFNAKDGSVRNRYSYQYQFDSKGNWTKRTTAKLVTKDGKSAFEPAWVTYRTITYY